VVRWKASLYEQYWLKAAVVSFYEPFSDRQRQQTEGHPETYIYDRLPSRVRGQVLYIIHDAVGMENWFWHEVEGVVARTKGLRLLSADEQKARSGYDMFTPMLGTGLTAEARVSDYIMDAKTMDSLDMIEYCFRVIDGPRFRKMPKTGRRDSGIVLLPDEAITAINEAFRRASVGYQFGGGQLNRVNDFFLHKEVVEPAISLLHEAGFEGAIEEFMRAHKQYREGNTKGAVVDANNAFESTMKTVCAKRGIRLTGTEKADDLVRKMIGMGYIPSYMKAQLDALRSMLNVLPVLRNRTGGAGHGQGATAVEVLDHVAAYALHLAASNIVFLVEAWKALERRDPHSRDASEPAGVGGGTVSDR
jgi:hypothetical protein